MPEAEAMRTLNSLGWDWRENGVVFHFVADGQPGAWFIPLAHVRMVFGKELAAVGCPLQPHVGDPPTVSGFFSSIKRAARSVSRGVKKAARGVSRTAKRAARGASRAAKKTYKRVVPKAIRKAARKVQKTALKAYKATSGLARKGLGLASNVPLLGNVSRLGQSALDIQSRLITKGKAPTLKQLGRVAKHGALTAADYFAPGAGTLAQAGLGAGVALAEGRRLDRALVEGGVRAASRYVPEQVVRGGLSAGQRIARGERIDRALTSGALTTARGYVPKGYARQGFDVARDIAGGKRADRVLKKKLLKGIRSKALRGVIPDGPSMQAAQSALQVARQADHVARRVRRGIHSAEDAAQLMAGRNTARGIRRIASRAAMGDPRARMFAKALHALGRR